ncbi:hypothetical protein B0T17DRAFT_492485 [Bombardia bombarda]|uniref:Uncharacterized protein n=1 Tax=Bombardia bombarda TaxID=252184 RepID=A0AA39X168_9PEZI|nr:hypothetical protein B0T17DRAFT_492485 [Bombardia bombarda]
MAATASAGTIRCRHAEPAPAPEPVPQAGGSFGAVDPQFIPPSFGVVANQGRVDSVTCTGINGALIPCNCPPARDDAKFLGGLNAALTQGFFPNPSIKTPITLAKFNDASDKSPNTNKQRATAMIQVMQSLSGTLGKGCPGVSFPTLINQQRTGEFGVLPASVGNAGK